MNFIEKLLNLISNGFSLIIETIINLVGFLAKPLSYLFWLLDGIFYFFIKLFDIVVHIIKIFVALFQFIGSICMGVFRTITSWLTVQPNTSNINLPSSSGEGLQAVIQQLQPTGLLTIVPMIVLALIWFFFAIKLIGLFGGHGKVGV